MGLYTKRHEYFGGVVIFTAEQFERINGYNTEYVGWGMEDDDLYWRCVEKVITNKKLYKK